MFFYLKQLLDARINSFFSCCKFELAKLIDFFFPVVLKQMSYSEIGLYLLTYAQIINTKRLV